MLSVGSGSRGRMWPGRLPDAPLRDRRREGESGTTRPTRGPRTRLGGRVRFEERYCLVRRHLRAVRPRRLPPRGRAHREIGAFLAGLRAIAERCGGRRHADRDATSSGRPATRASGTVSTSTAPTSPDRRWRTSADGPGLSVARHRPLFGGQYQLSSSPSRALHRTPRRPRRPVELTDFARYAEARRSPRSTETGGARRRRRVGDPGGGGRRRALASRAAARSGASSSDTNPAKQGLSHPGHSRAHRRAGRPEGASSRSFSSRTRTTPRDRVDRPGLWYKGTVSPPDATNRHRQPTRDASAWRTPAASASFRSTRPSRSNRLQPVGQDRLEPAVPVHFSWLGRPLIQLPEDLVRIQE